MSSVFEISLQEVIVFGDASVFIQTPGFSTAGAGANFLRICSSADVPTQDDTVGHQSLKNLC